MFEKGCPARLRSPDTHPILAQNDRARAGSRTRNSPREKVEKKGVSCFVYTYEEKNEALLTMHKRLNKIVAPSLLVKVLFPHMGDCLMSTAIFRTRDGQAIAVSAVCDGGDQGCGGGLLLLMLQAMKRLEPGAVLEVRSTDPGVRKDLPAWCRMTGNALLAEQEGEQRNRYFLRKA